jgi:hypothetical protein
MPKQISLDSRLYILVVALYEQEFDKYCDVLPKAGILKSRYTAIASQRFRQTRSRRNGEVGY